MTPEALLLDFDGTLVDWRSGLVAGIRAAATEFARLHGFDADEVAARTLAFEAEVFEAHLDAWTLGGMDAFALHGAVWRRAHAEYGVDDHAAPAFAEAHWQAELAGMRRYDDVTPLLAAARSAGIRTAIITNGPGAVQRGKLEAVGLADAFDAVLISAEVGSAKPDVRIFELALAELGVAPERAWHIGDTLAFDIAGARAAGVEGVWINRDGVSRDAAEALPHREIATLAELVPLLARAA
ncbi:HAD family hydrolase [Gryllotalpicola reticulitermitis]|uniref:HAD family hydrolase n=1 Tax=Gryllotalpicola reticulitermitis TaxID=1184153 RepID=A0ABV8Q5R0_9MICO